MQGTLDRVRLKSAPEGGEAGEWNPQAEEPVHIHSVLFTLDECGVQHYHTDGPDPHCISSILALEPGQEVRIALDDGRGVRVLRRLALETGEIVLFRGHVCHSGSNPPGMRPHTYMFAPEYDFKNLVFNATFDESDLYPRMSALRWDSSMPPVRSQRAEDEHAEATRAAAAARAAKRARKRAARKAAGSVAKRQARATGLRGSTPR